MTSPAAVTSIGTGLGIVFSTHKMPAAGAAMPAPAKYPDLINKI
jgi:hypothetical protein